MTEHDVFICHASVDKAAIARPLAKTLSKFGARVWFDEFSLRLGDGLTVAIDKGLSSSRFGVVILSKAFFSNGRTQHELSGLRTKEISSGKTIVPIWHNVDATEVRNFSVTLADKLAIKTGSASIQEIGLRILRVVRPDIADNFARWHLWRSLIENKNTTMVPLGDIKISPIRHRTLPNSLIVRIRLVYEALEDAGFSSLEAMIANFRRDFDPAREVEIWAHIAASYQHVCKRRNLTSHKKQAVLQEMIKISFLDKEGAKNLLEGGDDNAVEALVAWLEVGVPNRPASKRRRRKGS
jgi:TIR domain